MAEYRDRGFDALGLQLIGLSVDEPVRAEAMREMLKLPFPILCDPGRAVVTAWGLLNEKEKGGIAYPAIFILDRDRTVRYRSLDRTAARVSTDGVYEFWQRGQPEGSQPRQRPVRPGLRMFAAAIRNALRHGVRVAKK